METSNQVSQILREIAMQLPSMLTMLGGIVVAIIRWKRHPRVSLTIVISLALMLLHLMIFAVVFATIHSMMSYENFRTLQTYQTIASVMYNLTLAILTAILITAIFMQRKKPPEGPATERLAEALAA
jgi:uncharacterized membrane protein YagU involved in acid resistance